MVVLFEVEAVDWLVVDLLLKAMRSRHKTHNQAEAEEYSRFEAEDGVAEVDVEERLRIQVYPPQRTSHPFRLLQRPLHLSRPVIHTLTKLLGIGKQTNQLRLEMRRRRSK
jgi:hypothetical protein